MSKTPPVVSFEHDIFLSFAYEDRAEAKALHERLLKTGLTVHFSADPRKQDHLGSEWTGPMLTALERSQHLLLHWSEAASNSAWVLEELDRFYRTCYQADKDGRRIYVVLKDVDGSPPLPTILEPLQYPDPVDSDGAMEVIAHIISNRIRSLHDQVASAESRALVAQDRLKDAFDLYRHRGFWRPFTEPRGDGKQKNSISLFLCGRDATYDERSGRGQGGRTNIDKWDFQTALDLNRYFSRYFPDVNLSIEDPISKRSPDERVDMLGFFDHFIGRLRNRDCIIVGSPDVSDFAELVLAKWHGVQEFSESRDKSKGFAIVKKRIDGSSAFYWRTTDIDPDAEGVVEISTAGDNILHQTTLNSGGGEMFGILTVVSNPWCDDGSDRRIVILSGFSGIATNALARFLTDDDFLEGFQEFDGIRSRSQSSNYEALIGVKFVLGDDAAYRDSRRIAPGKEAVFFKKLVELGDQPPAKKLVGNSGSKTELDLRDSDAASDSSLTDTLIE